MRMSHLWSSGDFHSSESHRKTVFPWLIKITELCVTCSGDPGVSMLEYISFAIFCVCVYSLNKALHKVRKSLVEAHYYFLCREE